MHSPLFIGSEIYRRSRYGGLHPLSIPRVSTVIDLARAMGLLDADNYLDSPRATPSQLSRFHDPRYIAAVRWAERAGGLPERIGRKYQLGFNGNPVYGEVFRRPATACGASLAAVDLLLRGERRAVFSPAGGTHHGRANRASGFCYFNDPVLAILHLLDRGADRVLYIDIDAHHCDGVQDALVGEGRVRIVSIHEESRWPHTGPVDDDGFGTAYNVPVPERLNDSEFRSVVDAVVKPLAETFNPEFIVLQAGADALQEDPLSKLSLSNNAIWDTVRVLQNFGAPLLVLGGGGYNPWSVARCWAGIWAVLMGRDPLEACFTPDAMAILQALTWSRRPKWRPDEYLLTGLRDPDRGGEIRSQVAALSVVHATRIRCEAI